MSLICHSCGKRAQRGNLVSHAKNRSHRKFMANLHAHWITEKGKQVRAKFCTKCLRTVRNRSHKDLKVKPIAVVATA